MSHAAFEEMVRGTFAQVPMHFLDLSAKATEGVVSARSDTRLVEETLRKRGDVRPKMVYGTVTETAPAVDSPLHIVLELLASRHNTLGVLLGTFADASMGDQRMRPLPTLPSMSRLLQVDVRNTSWGQGRNRLLRVAQELFPDYEYIALSDDDALTELRCCRALPSMPCAAVLEQFYTPVQPTKRLVMPVDAQQLCVTDFERHLGAVRPHFAGLLLLWRKRVDFIEAMFQRAIHDGGSTFQATNWAFADAIFNAFSREAIDLDKILPYDEEVEKSSWWMSQAVVNLRLLCKYGRSASLMVTTTISPYNGAHRQYPRGMREHHPHYLQAIADLKDPVKCPMQRNAGRPPSGGGA